MATVLDRLLELTTLSGTNTTLEHFMSISGEIIVEKPEVSKGTIFVIDEMEINIEVIETKLDFSIKPISYAMDIDLRVDSNDLKIDIECL